MRQYVFIFFCYININNDNTTVSLVLFVDAVVVGDSERLQLLINQGGSTVVPSQHRHQSRDDSYMLIQWQHYSLYSHKCTGTERKTTHTGKSATGLDLLNQATSVTTLDSQNAGKRVYKPSNKTTESLGVDNASKTHISVI